ncbi:MAG: glutathione-regulated potassium-efflux system ancillary protein KefC [Candidatus Latescibacterota bacterium]|jgi:glutathione-regulated potassium-efflux system ancillary protein KefC
MHEGGFFFQAFVYLMAAVISVPIAKRIGLGSVLGYLIAGIVIGPFALGLVGEEGQDVMHFAEFGVVMMLFLIGLELQPALLWRLRAPILGTGGLQVGVTTVLIGGIALAFGQTWQVGLALGMTLSLSSTAIVLQGLNEKGLMKTEGGQSSFSVLLFQDIAVIPMLAIFPLLAVGDVVRHDDGHGSVIAHLPGWQQGLVVIALVIGIVIIGRVLMRPVFRFIASTRLRESFTATALLLVIGIAMAMSACGLSPALGTFVAGVVLADSEYRHELESNIEPFKGLLLGLFFIAVGASIDFNLFGEQPGTIASLVGGLVVLKFAVLFALGAAFKLPVSQNFLFSFALAEAGEFGFVLFSFATQNQVLPPDLAGVMVVVVALSMLIAPFLMIINDKLVQPRFATRGQKREMDTIDEENAVIIAGFGRFGNVVGRLLKAQGIGTTVLDLDPEQIEVLRHFGLKVFYGDAGRLDLLHSAGAEHAKVLLLAIDEPEKVNMIAEEVQRHFPHLKVLARAESMQHAYELMDIGVEHVFRETFDSALSMGIEAMKVLGFRAYEAHRVAKQFKQHEQETNEKMFELREDREAYAAEVRERLTQLESLMRQDEHDFDKEVDHAWNKVKRPDE